MVAQTIALPNVRKLFIPDPGYVIADADLSGADARVVAWEANDEELMDAFNKGLSVHLKNVRDMFPDKVKGWSDEAIKATDQAHGIYHDCKQMVHATNYGGSSRTIAGILGWTTHEIDSFQKRWLGTHPGIGKWHQRVEISLASTRTVYNKFGFRRVYFDRVDGLLPEALAWIPQSTVAITANKGAKQIEARMPDVELLLQNHDSWAFQYPKRLNFSKYRETIRKNLEIEIPYDTPLVIPWGLKFSEKSWGDC